jgi:preprotein translocase subunit SecG
MFLTLVLVVHVIVCIALILIILLQSGKGADIGAVFGGGSSQTVFGSSGAGTFLSKITIAAAVIFMLTSIILTYFSGKGLVKERSLVTEQSVPAATSQETVPAPAATGSDTGAAKPEGGASPGASVPTPSQAPAAAPAGGAPAGGGDKPPDAK